MQFVILALIFAVMAFQYLVVLEWVPSQLDYLPELLALAACVAVILLGVQNRFRYVRPVYWLVFGALAIGRGLRRSHQSARARSIVRRDQNLSSGAAVFFLAGGVAVQ